MQHAMTVGELSRRTGVSVKKLRQYEDRGLIYSLGRSPSGCRLFDDDALWCVEVISTLRSLGLTEAQIQRVGGQYIDHPDEPIGPYLAVMLDTVRARVQTQIDDLRQQMARIDAFERAHRAALSGHDDTAPWGPDPRLGR